MNEQAIDDDDANIPQEIEDDDYCRRHAMFRVTPELIKSALNMPKESEIIYCEFDHLDGNIKLFACAPDLPEVDAGAEAPEVFPTVTIDPDKPDEPPVWAWGVPNGQ